MTKQPMLDMVCLMHELDHLHINYEELIEYIKAKQPKDSAELTSAICSIYPSDRRLINKIVEVLIELDPYIREIEFSWYVPSVDHIAITFDIDGNAYITEQQEPFAITI